MNTTKTCRTLATGPSLRLRLLAVAGLFLVCLAAAGTLASGELWKWQPSSNVRGDEVPYVGITYVSLSHDIAIRYSVGVESGLLVTAVSSGSPAATAGIQRGDVILALDGVPVTGANSLIAMLAAKKPGDPAGFRVQRAGEAISVELTLGTRSRA